MSENMFGNIKGDASSTRVLFEMTSFRKLMLQFRDPDFYEQMFGEKIDRERLLEQVIRGMASLSLSMDMFCLNHGCEADVIEAKKRIQMIIERAVEQVEDE